MKRWPVRILLCLIFLTGGAITTVALAEFSLWARPMLSTPPARSGPVGTDAYRLWETYAPPNIGAPSSVLAMSDFGASIRLIECKSGYLYVAETGWPRHSRQRIETSAAAARHANTVLWPGFVIDTLFYAAIWGGMWSGCVGGKRFIRSKRGRCPRCGYDLRGAPGVAAGCSEFGWGRK